MKNALLISLRSASAALILMLPVLSHGQGQLNPPGPAFTYPNERALNGSLDPIPSMKTLMHIDAGQHLPSRDIGMTNFDGSLGYYNLNAPGRYYLTENLTKRILVSSDNVTIDLGGFEILYSGSTPGLTAISSMSLTGLRKCTKVINGCIRGGWTQGIEIGDDSVVSGVDVSQVTSYSIKLGKNGLIADCRAHGLWITGQPGGPNSAIFGNDGTVIARCTATGIAGIGIQVNSAGRVVDCTVTDIAGCGIVTMHSCSVAGCAVRTCGSTGFDLGKGCSLANSSVELCGSHGVHVRQGTTINNVTSRQNTGHGFQTEPFTIDDQGNTKNATNFVQCLAQGNTQDGFYTTRCSVFAHCTADKNGSTLPGPGGTTYNIGSGFTIYKHCRITDCVATHNLSFGISVSGEGNTIDGSTIGENLSTGIYLNNDLSTVTRNTFQGNGGSPINLPTGNGIAPIQMPAVAVNPFANFSF